VTTVEWLMQDVKLECDKVGTKMYHSILDEEDQAVVAFGMIPKHATDILEKQLADKWNELFKHRSGGSTPEEYDGSMTNLGMEPEAVKCRDKWVRAQSKEVCIHIYSAASAAGRMVV